MTFMLELVAAAAYFFLISANWMPALSAESEAANTSVFIKPLFDAVLPFVAEIIAAILVSLLFAFYQQLKQHFEVLRSQKAQEIENQARNVLQSAAENAAGRWMAKQSGPIHNLSIDVHSEGIAAEVRNVVAMIPDSIQKLNISPADVGDVVAKTIVAKIGLKQAEAPAPTTTNSSVVAVPDAGQVDLNIGPNSSVSVDKR